jgi:transcriptional regulator with XRE-family HTH domain
MKAEPPRRRQVVKHTEVGARLAAVNGVAEGIALQQQIARLGAKLRLVREENLQFSQTVAAELAGLPQSELSRIEAGIGRRGPSYATVTRILAAYEAALAGRGQSLSLSIEVRDGRGRRIARHIVAAGSGSADRHHR